jgi:hypothetical protein
VPLINTPRTNTTTATPMNLLATEPAIIRRLITFDPADPGSRGYRLELTASGLMRITYRSNRSGDLDGTTWIGVPPGALVHGLSRGGDTLSTATYQLAKDWLSDSSARRGWTLISRGARNE